MNAPVHARTFKSGNSEAVRLPKGMGFGIGTEVCVERIGDRSDTRQRVLALNEKPFLSMITRIELENGVNREPAGTTLRRHLLDRLLETFTVEMFTHADILAYGAIVCNLGYDRPHTLDRLIAAQAIARDARLITRNGKHFPQIDGLKLVEWETP